jgi:hypothetical protein
MKKILFAALLAASTQAMAFLPNAYFEIKDPLNPTMPQSWETFRVGTAKVTAYLYLSNEPGFGVYRDRHVRVIVSGAGQGSYAGIKVDEIGLQKVTPGRSRRYVDEYHCTAPWPVVAFFYDANRRFKFAQNLGRFAIADNRKHYTSFVHLIPPGAAYMSIARIGTVNGQCSFGEINSVRP